MKKLVLAALALALAAPASAQEARRQFGLGIGIDEESAPGSPVELYLPLNVAPQLRIEPSFGLRTGDDRTDVTIGSGLFLVQRLAPALDLLIGGRLKLNFASVDRPGDDESGTDLYRAGALGGEYYLVPRFSLGLEGNLGFYSQSDASGDDSGLFTASTAFLRVYF